MTVEPAQDYTVPTILLFAQQMGELTPPVLQPLAFSSSSFSAALTGATGNNFVIQTSTNFYNWQSLQTNPAPFNFTDSNAGSYTSRFYRAVSQP
jgi:hypothetical protein